MCEFHSSGVFILLREEECSSCYLELDYVPSSEMERDISSNVTQLNIRLLSTGCEH